MYGHDGVHGAFADFCSRWDEGVGELVKEGDSLSDGLKPPSISSCKVRAPTFAATPPPMAPPAVIDMAELGETHNPRDLIPATPTRSWRTGGRSRMSPPIWPRPGTA